MRYRCIIAAGVAALCCALPAAGQPVWVEPPAGGTDMLPASYIQTYHLGGGEFASSQVIAVSDMPFAQAIRVNITQQPSTPWSVQLIMSTTGEVRTGDVGLVCFFVRRVGGGGSFDEVQGAVKHQWSVADWDAVSYTGFRVGGGDWRQIVVPFQSPLELAEGEHSLVVHLGTAVQELDIAAIRLINYGDTWALRDLPDTTADYEGRELDAAWRAEAAARIEQYRKGDLTVRVTDALGTPLAGTAVRAEMTRHAFGFGSAVTGRMLGITPAEYDALPTWAKSGWTMSDVETYRAIVEAFFNKVVLENTLKWTRWETAKSNTDHLFRMDWIDRSLAWLGEREIEVRGHTVCWCPMDSDNGTGGGPLETVLDRLYPHMVDEWPTLGTRVQEYDVLTHPIGWGTIMLEDLYGRAVYAEVISLATLLGPHAEMWLNEDGVLAGLGNVEAYEQFTRDLIALGSPPDGVGFQCHFTSHSDLISPEQAYEVLDRFAAIIPNLQINEVDVTTYDEQLQADYLRDFMTVAFSHPNMHGILMWGFWEGRHWSPQAALFRKDWSAKPAAFAWVNLVFNEWWTDEQGPTDAAGEFDVRGFLGRYDVTAECRGHAATVTAELVKDGTELTIALDVLAGDFNDDGTVSGADYVIWASTFGNDGSSGKEDLRADANGDGRVTGADYVIWASSFGASSP